MKDNKIVKIGLGILGGALALGGAAYAVIHGKKNNSGEETETVEAEVVVEDDKNSKK